MEGVTLAIDASIYDGTVAVLRGESLVAERAVAMRSPTEERLMPAVADAMARASVTPRDLTRIVCGAGPGSFTSLRIAGAIAKGLARAHGAPLFEVSSLALAAVEAGIGRWLVTFDALRGDVYAAAYLVSVDACTALMLPRIVQREDAAALASSLDGTVVDGKPHARAVGTLMRTIVASGPVDLASWEPGYGRLAEAQVRWEAAHGRPLVP